MLDRQRDRESRVTTVPGRRRHRPAFEPLEAREVQASLGSFFSGLFPTFTSTSTTNATTKQQNKILRTPSNVSFPPYDITAIINKASDPGQTGVVFGSGTVISGIAPAYSTVWLAYGPLGYFNTVTRAGPDGQYAFAASVPKGTTQVRVFAEAPTQAYSNIATLRVTNADPIVAWDAFALRLIQEDSLSPEEASRNLAILHTAQYDAVVAATGQGKPYAIAAATVPGASPEVAADYAAFTVLAALFPNHASEVSLNLVVSLASLPNSTNLANDPGYKLGTTLGQDVGGRTVALHAGDGSQVTGPTGTIVNPNWGQVVPFAINSGSQFRPPAPPSAGTTAFDQALAEVSSLGRDVSTTRSASQTTNALFWNDGPGTATNVGHWNTIAQQAAVARKSSLLTNARTFAMLNVAMADAAIAADDARTTYNTPRPQATIRATSDPTWTPLLPEATPTPSYVSEHAAFGTAAATVLGAAFGKATPFTVQGTSSFPTATRTYASFAAAAAEEANSRIYAGTNYRFDVTAGATLGTQVANVAVARFKQT